MRSQPANGSRQKWSDAVKSICTLLLAILTCVSSAETYGFDPERPEDGTAQWLGLLADWIKRQSATRSVDVHPINHGDKQVTIGQQ